MKTLQYYKTKLGLTNHELSQGFNVSSTTVSKWLTDGAPLSVLKQLESIK